MSYEAYVDSDDGIDGYVTEAVAEECFTRGAQVMREMLARFVEQGGDAAIAASIRANWNPFWGQDPGMWRGAIPADCWSDPAAVQDAMEHFHEVQAKHKLPGHDETVANLDALTIRSSPLTSKDSQ